MLWIVDSSDETCTLYTGSLKFVTTYSLVAWNILTCLVLLVTGWLLYYSNKTRIDAEYESLRSRSNQGYLYEMTCERLENFFVNCTLERTDVNGSKSVAFSTPIKSASSSVVTTNVYTCTVSLVKRDGQKISDLEIFTNAESSKKCPIAKRTTQQINDYILGKTNKPLYWRKDTRVGDLTQGFQRNYFDLRLQQELRTVLIIAGGVYLFAVVVIFLSVEEAKWKIDKRSGQVSYTKRGWVLASQGFFALHRIRFIEKGRGLIEINYEKPNGTLEKVTWKVSTKQEASIVSFLESATGLKATERVYSSDSD